MGKGIGRVYKHSQRNWPYPSLNITFVVPPLSDNTTFHGTIGGKITSPDNQIATKPLACLYSTSKLDSEVNLGDDSNSFSTPRKKITVSQTQLIRITFPTK